MRIRQQFVANVPQTQTPSSSLSHNFATSSFNINVVALDIAANRCWTSVYLAVCIVYDRNYDRTVSPLLNHDTRANRPGATNGTNMTSPSRNSTLLSFSPIARRHQCPGGDSSLPFFHRRHCFRLRNALKESLYGIRIPWDGNI